MSLDSNAKQILKVLTEKPNLKARQIASLLGMERKLVNHYLYSDLKHLCVQNEKYEWSVKDSEKNSSLNNQNKENESAFHNSKDEQIDEIKQDYYSMHELAGRNPEQDSSEKRIIATNSEVDKTDRRPQKNEELDPLQKLCKYYIDCLLLEKDNGIEVYAESKFDLKYREFDELPFGRKGCPEGVNELVQKIMTSKSMYGFLGYPVLVKTLGKYKKLSPIFLWEMDNETGAINLETPPIINTDLIKHYVVRSNEAVAKELVRLEKELEIYDADYLISIQALIDKLVDVRKWEWNEELDSMELNKTPFASIERQGIYNKAILVAESQSPYTKGLITELQKLSEKTINDCKGTALYDWIVGGIRSTHDQLEKELMCVLPLNYEQRQAIEKALTGDLTVVTGPPGTGKSQVVIDLLINQIYNSQSVLFCSKNNKAVDVVVKRSNELTKIPFICKLGGQAGDSEIAYILNKLLNADDNKQIAESVEKLEDNYCQNAERLKYIRNQIIDTVDKRNHLDQLEQSVEIYRRQYGDYYSAEMVFDTNDILEKWNAFLSLREATFKQKQGFFARIRWNSISPEREKKVLDYVSEIKPFLDLIHETIPANIDQVHNMNIEAIENELKIAKVALDYVFEYIAELNSFIVKHSDKYSIEGLEREYGIVEDYFYQAAKDYWDAWLSANHASLRAKDKQTIIEYLNGLKLMNVGDEDEIPDQVKKSFKKVQKAIPKYVNAQAVTLLSAKGRIPFDPGCFDMIVIDEASQCDIASAIPLLYRAKKAVIIGDMNQLAHVSTLPKRRDQELMNKYGIEKDLSWSYSVSSLFALAQSRASSENVVKLKEHHRSHADIIEFSNREFYGGDLVTATKYDRLVLPDKETPGVRWIDVKGHVVRPPRGSAENTPEAEAVVRELKRLSEVGYKGGIGVISPFRAQAEKIRRILQEDQALYETLERKNNIEINTVHQFQGDERDIIIFSTTISKGMKDGQKLFLRENGNLFNVAITRARGMLIAIGDFDYCSSCGIRYLEHFASYAEEKARMYRQELNRSIQIDGYENVTNMDQVSKWEIILHDRLKEEGINTYPQYPIDKYKLDLALFDGCRKLDIEVDGEMYHKTWDGDLCYRDQLRNQRMYELGWDVRRFWVYQIRDDIDNCVNTIREWISM